MATNRNKDPYEAQRNHQSMPLSSLKDPSSFAPPPKHSGWYGSDGTPTSPAGSRASGGLGSAVPAPARRPMQEQQQQQQLVHQTEQPTPPRPGMDPSKFNTTNLPKPPVRRADSSNPAPPTRSAASPVVPARQPQPTPGQKPAPVQRAPVPMLPPRQNEHPDEYTPPPPPTYQEATVQPVVQPAVQPAQHSPATINGVAVGRLAQAGVNVPGFGIGGGGNNNSAAQWAPPQSTSTQGHPTQLSELQQRFSRMGTGAASSSQASPPPTPTSASMATATAQKKPPPPPPPKKAGLGGNRPGSAEGEAGEAPPPLPLSSKPRPS